MADRRVNIIPKGKNVFDIRALLDEIDALQARLDALQEQPEDEQDEAQKRELSEDIRILHEKYTEEINNFRDGMEKLSKKITDLIMPIDTKTIFRNLSDSLSAIIKPMGDIDFSAFGQLALLIDKYNLIKEDGEDDPEKLKDAETEIIETIESLKSVVPQIHIKPNNKLANEITRDFINEGEQALIINNSKSKREIITKAMLTYIDDSINLTGRARFTPYDREVHDGVVTLYEVGNIIITPAMVYRAMNGMTESEYISPQAVGAVTRSLEKSRRIMVNIDYSQEVKAYKKNCKATYEGYLLACDKITVSISGKTQEAFRLLRKPILYEYSQVSGQIINIPISLLQTREAVRGTEEVIVIRGYLLRQISGMKSKSFARSNKISYEGIYTVLDMDGLSSKAFSDKSLKVRKHISALLSEWTEQNFIKDYAVYKEGKTHKGVAITL